MMDIRAGERSVPKLAETFLATWEWEQGYKDASIDRASCLVQIQLFILSQWIRRADHIMFGSNPNPAAISLCLEITQDLHQSMSQANNKKLTGSLSREFDLRAIQRATLHRLFSLVFPFTKTKVMACPAIPFQALGIIADIVSDNRLRPAQARYLCRKFLLRLRDAAVCKIESQEYSDTVWKLSVKTIVTLIQADIVRPHSSQAVYSPSKSESDVDTFLRSLCLAISNKQIKEPWTSQAVLEVVYASQDANLKKAMDVSGGLVPFKGEGKNAFAVAPFVSPETLEYLSKILVASGQYWLVKELIFMAPREQRSIRALTYLMRKWSNVPPDFVPGGVLKRRSNEDVHSYRNCKTSQRIWVESMALLDPEDVKYRQKLVSVFSSRMASHARSKTPGLVFADLKALQSLIPGKATLPDVLLSLHEKAQVDSIRAFTRAGNLARGRKWAQEILSSMKDKHILSTARPMIVKDPGSRILNVLLIAYLQLRLRNKVKARRRFSLMIRRGALVKEQRAHLRPTINRYLRVKKRKMLRRWRASFKNRKTQLEWTLSFLEAIATRHGILPNDQTTYILTSAILRLSPRKVSDAVLRRIRDTMDWDWQVKGVSGVLNELRRVLEGKEVTAMCYIEEEGLGHAKRVTMINNAIAKRRKLLLHDSHQTHGRRTKRRVDY